MTGTIDLIMMYEIMIQKTIKIAAFLGAGAIQLIAQFDPELLPKGFDEVGTIVLLLIGIYFIYQEWKDSEEYNKKRDKRMETIVENNTEAFKNLRHEMKNVHSRIDHNRYLINEYRQEQGN